jgi:hypothetical protein
LAPTSGSAISLAIPGEDGGGLNADVSATFLFDDTCDTNCTLTVILTYNSVDGTLNKNGQALSGVIWDPVLTGGTSKDLFGTNVTGQANEGSGTALLTAGSGYVGNGATDASLLALAGNVSPHWAFHPNLQFGIENGLGGMLLTSVGDITFDGATWDQDSSGVIEPDELFTTGAGTNQLLAGSPSNVELSPPNGIDFALLPTGTCPVGVCPNPLGNDPDDALRALIENSITVDLAYTGGTLTDIASVSFLFGTDGNIGDGFPPAPEPGGLLLLGSGLLGLALFSRKKRG